MPMIKNALAVLVVAVVGLLFFSYSGARVPASIEGPWPPHTGEIFPDILLRDIDGHEVRLSDYRGKVIILEPIGMTCAACNAFAGGHEKGGFGGTQPQQGLDAFEYYLYRYGNGARLDHPDIILIQMLLYNLSLKAPSPEEGRLWAEHFGLLDRPNTVVLVGGSDMQNNASYKMIPGFFLIDKQFRLRADGTGRDGGKQNIYTELLPMIPSLLRE